MESSFSENRTRRIRGIVMKYFKDNNNKLVVIQDKDIFKNSFISLAFEFVTIDKEIKPLVSIFYQEEQNLKEEIENYEIMFNEDYKEKIKSIIRDRDRLENRIKGINDSHLSKIFKDTIKEIKETIKQF